MGQLMEGHESSFTRGIMSRPTRWSKVIGLASLSVAAAGWHVGD
jgi:hypothetical protein